MATKKPTLDTLLNNESPQPPIRRGQGMRLSHEEQVADADSHERSNAATHRDDTAVPQRDDTAEPQRDDTAEPHQRSRTKTQSGWKRVNRGYMLREDLIKACKRLALEEDRNLYEVMEEALEQYLEQHPEARVAPPPYRRGG